MIKIGICDDEINIANHVEQLVKTYFDERGLSYSTKVFNDPLELNTYLDEKGGFDILLLDIYMPMLLGTEIAKTLLNEPCYRCLCHPGKRLHSETFEGRQSEPGL